MHHGKIGTLQFDLFKEGTPTCIVTSLKSESVLHIAEYTV